MSDEELSKDSRTRLEAMCETTDGFRLAELDLRLRGAGDINGTLQSGSAIELKIANPALDNAILQTAQSAAMAILAADPALDDERHRPLRELKARYSTERREDFSMIS
jgi:ATP-dependent DNA helicase RecG